MIRFEDLFAAASVVSLRVHCWGAAEGATPEDFGNNRMMIEPGMSEGRYRLVPKEAFAAITTVRRKAREIIAQNALPLKMIKGAHFITEAKAIQVAEQLAILKEMFWAAVNDFISKIDGLRTEQIEFISTAIRAKAKTPLAAEHAIQRVTAAYPSADEIRSKFGFDWAFYKIEGTKTSQGVPLSNETGEVVAVIDSIVADVYEQVTERLNELSAVLSKTGKIHPRSIAPTRKLLTSLRGMLGPLMNSNFETKFAAIESVLNSYDVLTADQALMSIEAIKAAIEEDNKATVAATEQVLVARRFRDPNKVKAEPAPAHEQPIAEVPVIVPVAAQELPQEELS